MDGVIVADKPEGITSHDVVNRMRRLAMTRRVGHLGTLDPLATGVLPLVIGKATRLARFFAEAAKVYDARVRFGYATDSYDRQGSPIAPPVEPSFSLAELEAALTYFRGTFWQSPPPVSAKKVAGIPAYKLARKQLPVELQPVEVTVHELELVAFERPMLRIRIRCAAGTYVRSIAHELGIRLDCGAHLDALRRTASSGFEEAEAHSLDELTSLAAESSLDRAVIPSARLLPQFPDEIVDDLTAGQIRQGRDFRTSCFRPSAGARYVKAISMGGDLIAIGEARLPNLYHPLLVL